MSRSRAQRGEHLFNPRRSARIPGLAPFFDDPFFRQFFGVPFESIPRERRERSLGSGVIVTEDGYILTNAHVVDGADEIKVALADDKTVYEAKVVGADPHTDVAVIKVEGRKFPAITVTDSDLVEVGDVVLAIGNPFGVGQTVTMGIVSAKGRAGMGIVDYEDFIQTDASINPGNSGGALVDAAGRLVGINQSIISRSGGNQGIGFSIPINLARYVMERLVTDGKVTRGYLGVLVQPVTPELAKEFNLPDNSGALIGEVTKDSPAEDAGLKEGDVIIQFNGRKVTDSRHLRLMASQTAPGTKVQVKFLRDGKEQQATVKLGELPEGGLAKADTGPGGLRRSPQPDVLDGVTVDDLDARTRRQFNLPAQLQGAVEVEVDPASAGAAAGLRAGDVILEINRQRVTNADELVRLSEQVKGNRVLLRVWSQAAAVPGGRSQAGATVNPPTRRRVWPRFITSSRSRLNASWKTQGGVPAAGAGAAPRCLGLQSDPFSNCRRLTRCSGIPNAAAATTSNDGAGRARPAPGLPGPSRWFNRRRPAEPFRATPSAPSIREVSLAESFGTFVRASRNSSTGGGVISARGPAQSRAAREPQSRSSSAPKKPGGGAGCAFGFRRGPAARLVAGGAPSVAMNAGTAKARAPSRRIGRWKWTIRPACARVTRCGSPCTVWGFRTFI
jgi:serine protease Do